MRIVISSRKYRQGVDWHVRLEQLTTPFLLLHLGCILIGSLIGFVYLTWTIMSWFWNLDAVYAWLPNSPLLDAPWKMKLWTVVALYGSFVWIFSLLFSRNGVRDRQAVGRRPYHTPVPVWSYTLLWGFVFGPLAYLFGWYSGLSWWFWALVLVGVALAFYREVYREYHTGHARMALSRA